MPNATPEFKVPHQPQILPTFYHSTLDTAETKVKQIHTGATSSLPNWAPKEDGQSWPSGRYELRFKRADAISIHRGAQAKNKGPRTEISTLKNPPLLADQLSVGLSDTAHLWSINSMIAARATLAFALSVKVRGCFYCCKNTISVPSCKKYFFKLHLFVMFV